MDYRNRPVAPIPGIDMQNCGITMREHFAAMAMQSITVADTDDNLTWGQIADNSVEAADALLKALEKS